MADSRGAIALPSVVAAAPLTAQGARGGGPAARLRSLSTNPSRTGAQSRTHDILQATEHLGGNLVILRVPLPSTNAPGRQLTLGTKRPQPRLFPTGSMRF
jgi:hypothetical protein